MTQKSAQPMTTVTLAKWSVDDYHQMIASGLLQGRQVELLQGSIVEMAPEKPIHYYTAEDGSEYLKRLLQEKAVVRFNGPITLQDSEPAPDIAIVHLPKTAYRERHPAAADIYWLIEVANTTLQTDLTLKAQLYASENIPEYWVLDLTHRQIVVFREPQEGEYKSEIRFEEDSITPLAFPEIEVSVTKILS